MPNKYALISERERAEEMKLKRSQERAKRVLRDGLVRRFQ